MMKTCDIQISKLRPVIRAHHEDVDAFFAGLPNPTARQLVMDPAGEVCTAWFYSDLTRTMYLLQRTELFIECWTLEGITRELCPRILDAMERLGQNPPTPLPGSGTDLIALAVASLGGVEVVP
jgi:hypothetical protein